MPHKDPIRRREYMRERQIRRRAEGYKCPAIRLAIERTNALKGITPCADCGRIFPPICMDFDHLRDKTEEVSRLVANGVKWEIIENEIEKCEIVCACCHRLRSQRQHYNR